MIPQLAPYTPGGYLPDSFGRYRQYPRAVRAQIPGTGYDVGKMVWAEQELNLSNNKPQVYGDYSMVPLRGLGTPALLTTPNLLDVRSLFPSGTTLPNEEITPLIGEAPEPNLLLRKVGPIPVWALGLVGVAVIGGGTWWFLRRRKK